MEARAEAPMRIDIRANPPSAVSIWFGRRFLMSEVPLY
jgi:hypothetical protein